MTTRKQVPCNALAISRVGRRDPKRATVAAFRDHASRSATTPNAVVTKAGGITSVRPAATT